MGWLRHVRIKRYCYFSLPEEYSWKGGRATDNFFGTFIFRGIDVFIYFFPQLLYNLFR